MREIKFRDASGHFIKGHPGLRGMANPMWKGVNAGYEAIHEWVYRVLGKPKLCSSCGTTQAKKFEWANISKEYRRDVADWKRLCTSCHRTTDGHGFKAWKTRRVYAA